VWFSVLSRPDTFASFRSPSSKDRASPKQTGNRRPSSHLEPLLASRLFPEGNAIGQHIQRAIFNPYLTLDGPVYTIVGIAANVKNAGLAGQDDPEFYTLKTSQPDGWTAITYSSLKLPFLPPS